MCINLSNICSVAHLVCPVEFNSLFASRSSWLQGDFPRQHPMRRLQVQTAQSCPDGELGGNKGIFLQGHSVRSRPPCGRQRSFSLGEEKRDGALPETGVHAEGRKLHPRTVTAQNWGHQFTGRVFMRLRKLPVCLFVEHVLPFSTCVSWSDCFLQHCVHHGL